MEGQWGPFIPKKEPWGGRARDPNLEQDLSHEDISEQRRCVCDVGRFYSFRGLWAPMENGGELSYRRFGLGRVLGEKEEERGKLEERPPFIWLLVWIEDGREAHVDLVAV